MPKDSNRNLKQLFPIATTNLTKSYCKSFKREETTYGADIEIKVFDNRSADTSARFKSNSREQTVCLRMPISAQFDFELTVHALKQFISPWNDLVSSCYIFYTTSLDNQLGL